MGLLKFYIYDLEKGKKYLKVDKIYIFVKVLGVDYDYMVLQCVLCVIQLVVDLLIFDVFWEFLFDDFGVFINKFIELLVNIFECVMVFISIILQMICYFQVL